MALVHPDTLTQLRSIERLEPVPSFFHDAFVGSNIELCGTEKAEWDYRKGSVRMAPFVAPNVGGVVMARQGFEEQYVKFPKITPERPVTMDDIGGRTFGEAVYGGMTPQQRALKLMAEDLTYLRNAIQLRKEWMVAQVVTTGTLDIIEFTGNGFARPSHRVDYKFTNRYAPVKTWDDPDADPLEDLNEMTEIVHEGQGQVEVILMAPDVAKAFLRHKKVLERMDILRANFGQIKPRWQSNSLRYLGTDENGVEMYVYAGKYLDDDGIQKPFMPNGTVYAGPRKMLRSLYGPVTQVETPNGSHITYIAKEVPLRYSSVDNNMTMQRLTSRPMFVPNNIDEWAIGKVL